MAVSPAVIKETQQALGQYIKKPPLTEKLLNKPPFRFLHDVFSIVIKDTGVLEGLFDETEMNSDNVKDKDSKVEYLSKIIDCLSLATGQTLAVKPGKIVSGQEADKTNEMLQLLAKVISNRVDTSDAVTRVRNGEKPNRAKKPSKKREEKDRSPDKKNRSPEKKDRSPDKTPKKNRENKENKLEKENNNRNSTRKSKKELSKSPENIMKSLDNEDEKPETSDLVSNGLVEPTETEVAEPSAVSPLEDRAAVPVLSRQESQDPPQPPPEAASPPAARAASAAIRPKASGRPEAAARPQTRGGRQRAASPEEQTEPQVLGSAEEQAGPARPTTAGQARRAGSARPKTGRLKSARPPSARPAAPSIKKKREVAVEEQPRPATAKVANVILDNDDDNEDDGEEFLIEEAPKDPLLSLETTEVGVEGEAGEAGAEHGALVQQILHTQAELQDGNKRERVEIEREAGVGEGGRARDRQSTQREVDKLRLSIQTLTKSAHPLGKLMDFLQEDVDSMQRELEQWRGENRSLGLELRQEEQQTGRTLQPLLNTLEELTAAVTDQLDKISTVKSNIIRNEEKIEKMMAGETRPSLWSRLAGLLGLSPTPAPPPAAPHHTKKAGLDMADVTFLLDMDGEGLCFHQIHNNKQAFKKEN